MPASGGCPAGKVIRRRLNGQWLAARIIETEAYLLEERGSHASLGYTEARRALFMAPGTIYMYYAGAATR
ncbi:DNA-3-methyladenine glycosylase [Halopseudomonas pachastrellae]|nr:DNA-3-methyladenine glycosylase [Halopseudomonas pachastrellae]